MTLIEKLHAIYSTIDYIEKKGHNKTQNYKFMQSADVVRAIRKQLSDLKVYAEINFDFVGEPFTIAREKAPTAPFSAVRAKCSLLFRDLESKETATGSGLGLGCDSNDKSAGKAQTNALKYALKNAFLVPDEADPEADESVDENSSARPSFPADPTDFPDFQEAQHAAPRPTPAPQRTSSATQVPAAAAAAFAEASTATPTAPSTAPTSPSATPAAAPSTPTETAPAAAREPGDEPIEMATEEEMKAINAQFRKLGDDLSCKEGGGLKSSAALPINRKLAVFVCSITGAASVKVVTKSQWANFFARVDAAKSLETGLVGLAKLVNKANGIEDKPKAAKK